MTVKEAIEIIEAACNHEESIDEEKLWDAQQLAIIVLKTRTPQEEALIDAIMQLNP